MRLSYVVTKQLGTSAMLLVHAASGHGGMARRPAVHRSSRSVVFYSIPTIPVTDPLPLRTYLPPGPVAAGAAVFVRGGRRHVSAGAPAVTNQVVVFGNLTQRWSFLSI